METFYNVEKLNARIITFFPLFSQEIYIFLVAKANYTALYEKYLGKEIVGHLNYGSKNPSLDCMGCARKVFCAYHFPFCRDTVDVPPLELLPF